jgi:hypothetical protein
MGHMSGVDFQSSSPKLYELEKEMTALPCRLRPQTIATFVFLRKPLHSLLDPCGDNPALRDVYVVMKHDITHRGTTQSRKHMSIYCNGHYYHLSARAQFPEYGQRPTGPKVNGSRTILKVNELFNPESNAYRHFQNHPGPALVAYHVGQTDCNPEQIRKLGEWIVGRLGTYDFLRNNCQHFVFCLLVRILCRGRNYTVLSMLQIAVMATKDCSDDPQFCNGFHTGFRLAGPDDGPAPSAFSQIRTRDGSGSTLQYLRSWWKRFRLNHKVDVRAYQLHYLWAHGEAGMLPDNILEYSAWRRQLLFPPVTNNIPKVRGFLLKGKPPYK